ncbi:MAG: hypothetical protein OXG42_03645 [Chloroflexi bacterium]|nr:hypothetical protein [Chloroflexota bacterium]
MATTELRKRQSRALLLFGAALVLIGLFAAVSVTGLVVLALAPLPSSAAALLAPSRWCVAAALCAWACWSLGLYYVLS